MRPEAHFGDDALHTLARALADRGARKILLLTGPSRRFVPELTVALEGVEVEVFDGAQVHVPVSVVAEAKAVAKTFSPDALLSLGGGAATGLGKALALELGLPLFAVPTTYAGSEMTSIVGTTEDGSKRTAREDAARPAAAAYVPAFLGHLPPALEMQSLFNALAHPISALSAEPGEARAGALDAIARLVGAAVWLAESPGHPEARLQAQRGAAQAGRVLDGCPMGPHHRLAHVLGGRHLIPHAALHAALLPHTLRHLADEDPALYAEIEAAAGLKDMPGQLFDLLRRVGAETMLVQLGLPEDERGEALPEVDAGFAKVVLQGARFGRRPTVRARLEDWGLDEPVTVDGGPLEAASTVVVALQARYASAESAVARARDAVGHRPGVTVVAPQAPRRAWYDNPYRKPAEASGARFEAALSTLDTVLERVRAAAPDARVVVYGFSQGACLACEHLARRGPRFDALVAFAAARLGPRDAYTSAVASLEGLEVLIGGAREDQRVRAPDTEATAAWLEAHGAAVERMFEPGDAHRVSARQRLRAGEVLLGRALFEGHAGFGNGHSTEALQGALPARQNSPRRTAYDLYAEQVNSTGFVAARAHNRRAWLYRIRPAAQHRPFAPLAHETFGAPGPDRPVEVNLAGWAPLPSPEAPTDFVDGLVTLGGAGDARLRRGFAVHLYAANRSMEGRAFYNADGELLLVPEEGALTVLTEQGALQVAPGQIAVIPRGARFSVLLHDEVTRGYVAEVYGRSFELPERGPVGANGLTDPRHFVAPSAWYEDRLHPGFRITAKLGGALFEATQDHSPYDVVAWHGNHAPYVYDLMDFSPVANARFDHGDPSVYTVLSAPMDELGAHSLDFVFFPPRWDVTEGTFRPPFFHRNAVTEINGIIRMPRDDDSMFRAGAVFLTPAMTPHGVRAPAVQRVFQSTEDPPPERMTERSMWFQFETALPLTLTEWAETAENRIQDWPARWGAYRTHFDPAEQPFLRRQDEEDP